MTRAPVLAAFAVGATGIVVLACVAMGPIAGHMALHIAAMNVAAPLASAALFAFGSTMPHLRVGLWPAAMMQMALLWAWHSPAVQHIAHGSAGVAAFMHLVLFLSAVVFWFAIIDRRTPWSAIAALLVSGKLACLLGVLLVFSPRLLMTQSHFSHAGHEAAVSAAALADQHLAGLLMITACPLSFVLAAIVLVAQGLDELRHARPRAFQGSRSYGG